MSMAFLVNNVIRHRKQNAPNAPYEKKSIKILRIEVDMADDLDCLNNFKTSMEQHPFMK